MRRLPVYHQDRLDLATKLERNGYGLVRMERFSYVKECGRAALCMLAFTLWAFAVILLTI